MAAGACALVPLLLGHLLLAAALFVLLFGVCWIALGPAFLLVAGAIDLTRAVDRAVEGLRPDQPDETPGRAGCLAVVTQRSGGAVSPAGPRR